MPRSIPKAGTSNGGPLHTAAFSGRLEVELGEAAEDEPDTLLAVDAQHQRDAPAELELSLRFEPVVDVPALVHVEDIALGDVGEAHAALAEHAGGGDRGLGLKACLRVMLEPGSERCERRLEPGAGIGGRGPLAADSVRPTSIVGRLELSAHEPAGELDGLVARGEFVEPSGRDGAGAEAGAEQRARGHGRRWYRRRPSPRTNRGSEGAAAAGGRGDTELPDVAVAAWRSCRRRRAMPSVGSAPSSKSRDHVAHPGARVGGMIVEVGELESVRAARARRSASWRWRSAIGAIRIRLPLPALRPARR